MNAAEPVDEGGDEPGYKRPPRSTRFQKGRSGNPKGRPRNRRREMPYDTLLGQMVTIREDGRERRVTAAEAFLLQLTRKGLQGDSSAARASLAAIETARGLVKGDSEPLTIMRVVFMTFGVGLALRDLGIAVKRNPLDENKVRWELKPWIVEAALERLGQKQLSVEEQREVWNACHKPEQINWPDWWTERG